MKITLSCAGLVDGFVTVTGTFLMTIEYIVYQNKWNGSKENSRESGEAS